MDRAGPGRRDATRCSGRARPAGREASRCRWSVSGETRPCSSPGEPSAFMPAGRWPRPPTCGPPSARSAQLGIGATRPRPPAPGPAAAQLRRLGDALVHARLALSLTADEQLMWMEARSRGARHGRGLQGQWATAAREVSAAHTAAADLGTSRPCPRPDRPGRLARAGTSGRCGRRPAASTATAMCGHPDAQLAGLVADPDRGDHRHRRRRRRRAASRSAGRAASDQLLDFRPGFSACGPGRPARGDLDQAACLFQQALDAFGARRPAAGPALLRHAFGSLLRARASRGAAWTSSEPPPAARRGGRRAVPPAGGRGSGPVRPAARGPDGRGSLALTEREQDVATLVAKGLTNREVAGELYVSEKAVEYHLRNVFGKLGISSRRELRDRRF